jgi:YHS domain-containing protein
LRASNRDVADLAKDPVCKMEVDEKTAKYKSTYMGKVFYFCSASCKGDFDKNPTSYVK